MRRGQAAMEYLTTYGWALLVVLVAIGALTYFGVIDTSRWIPSNLEFSEGISPGQYKIDEGHFTFSILNNFGYDIQVLGYSVESTEGSDFECSGGETLANSVTIINGETYDFHVVDCTGATPKQRFKADIVLTYAKEGESIMHDLKGSVQTVVESGAEPYCGDGNCDDNEGVMTCSDCAVAGDGICSPGEGCSECGCAGLLTCCPNGLCRFQCKIDGGGLPPGGAS